MPGGDDFTEMRALQERAYGRAGGLSPADAARLRELEDDASEEDASPLDADSLKAGSTTVVRPSDRENAPVVGRAAPPRAELNSVQHVAAASTDSSDERATGPEHRAASVLRSRWTLLAGVLLVAILAGMLLGWALFSPRATPTIHLDATQQSWQDEILISGTYDSGSVRAIAEEDGTIVWFATRDGGEIVCAIVGDGITTSPACRERALALMQGLQTSLRRDVEGGQDQVDAQVQFDAEGDPAVLTSHQLIGTGSRGVYTNATEQQAADQLMESGFAPNSLTIVGHDGDVPIWIGVDRDSARWCLIYDGSSSPFMKACDETNALINEGGSLAITLPDADTGASTTFEYRFGPGSSYLQITRSADDAGS